MSDIRLKVIEEITKPSARDKQRKVGPSEIGNPCTRCLGRALAGERKEQDFSLYPWIGLVLGLVVEIISICYLSLLIFGGDRLAGMFRRHQRLSRMGNGSVGLLFMGFAARMIGD